jgi:predicted ATP-grasp superfamily ATP-dependent carboligase
VGERVLLLADESTGSLASVRALHAGGYEPYVGVAQDDAYAARSRAAAGVLRLPATEEPDTYAQAVAEEARRLSIAAVLPATEMTLRALSGRESLFPKGTALGTNAVEKLDLATDKARIEELAARAGLQAPKTIETTGSELDANLAEIRFPAIVKPLRSAVTDREGRLRIVAVERVDDERALREAVGVAPDEAWVVQPYVEGTLAAIGGIVWEGELVCAVHQVSPRIWPVGKGISSFATTVPPDARRQRGVARMFAEIGWSGIYGVQFVLVEDGAYLIDVNPRIYGSIGLAIAAGQNLPAIWVDLLLGRTPRVHPYRLRVNYRVEISDYRALVAELRNGNRRDAVRGLLPRRRTTHGIFSWRDPAPLLTLFQLMASRVSR